MEDLPKHVASREVYSGPIFRVRVDTVEYDGVRREIDVVEHRGSIAILPLIAPDRLLLVRQYRHPAGHELWELPAGMTEPEEDPEVGAYRELREETGYKAGRMTHMFSAYATPGYCTEMLHLFVAEDLRPGEQQLDEDERITIREVTLPAALAMQASGQIIDLKTVAALMWLAQKV
ncbi:MAG: NUDIX hydrolase [Vulcanimicrobiaceae bacterium]